MQQSQALDSPIPRSLLRSPRRVRRKPGTLGLLMAGRILTAPVLAGSAVLLAFAVLEPMVVFGLPAQPARVIGRWLESVGRRPVVYYIEYRLDRSGFTARDQVLQGEYRAYHIGQAVKAHLIQEGLLRYSALDRSFTAYARNRMVIWLAALFGAVMGGALVDAIWFSPWRAHWLMQHGQTTFGAVVEKRMFFVRRLHGFCTLTYQFKALGTLRARRIRINTRRFDSAGVKDLVIILFDPARPDRNIIYDYCDFVAM